MPKDMPKDYKRQPLVVVSALKSYVKHVSQTKRNGKFTQVSAEFVEKADAVLRNWVTDQVMRQGGGKTL